MPSASAVLILLAIQGPQAGLIALIAVHVLKDPRRGDGPLREAVATFAFWMAVASPFLAGAPVALEIVAGPAFSPVVDLQAFRLMRRSGPLDTLALVLLIGLALAAAVRLIRLAVAAVRSERAALAFRAGARQSSSAGPVVFADVPGPMAVGILHPVVVLPERLAGADPDDHGAFIRHEMEHLRRADLLHNLLQDIALAVFWWNPGLRRLSRLLADEREFCCDSLAAGPDLAHRQGYARRLVKEAWNCIASPPAPRAVRLTGDQGRLARRTLRLAGLRGRLQWALTASACVLIFAVAMTTPRLETADTIHIGLATS